MAAVLVWLARCLLALTLIAAPWAFGGADLPLQRWLLVGIVAAGTVGWVGVALGRTARLSRWAVGFLLLATGLIAIGAIQLAPHPHWPVFAHAVLTDSLGILDGDDSLAAARSLQPTATRLWMSRLAVAILAFLSGAWLFGDRGSRGLLWALLGLNGVAVVGFGLVQRASWNGKLYWSIPLELGGQPFAAFVNRNNAAEYVSMCLAGALGLWAACRIRARPGTGHREFGTSLRVAPSIAERVPATAWGVMILLLFGGVLATLSRAGALSAIAGVIIVGAWVGAGRRSRTLLLPLLGIVVAAGVWISLTNQAAALRERLGSLSSSIETDGRIRHWHDMRAAVEDFARIGTGLGTYRYANKPYETHRSESWFESADNQYLELMVEGGIPAAAITAMTLLLAAGLAHAWRRSENQAEAIACGYVVVAIGLQSITDCWMSTAANLLTLATLAGSLSNPDPHAAGAALSSLDKVNRLMESRRGFVPAIVIGLCALLAAGLGAYEVNAAAQSTLFRRSLPDVDERPDLTQVELDGLLAAGEELSTQRPDDAELHAALARLWFYRYRCIAAARLDVVAPERWNASARWERTSPQALLGTLARYEQIGDAATMQRFRESPAVVENLGPMSEHARAARRSCPILPHLGLLKAIDALLADGDPSLPLRREAALSPARVRLLHAIAKSGEMISDEELFAVCLARCIEIDPEHVMQYVETARTRLSEPAIIERLLPQQPDTLLEFADQARSTAGRALALDRAAAALEASAALQADESFLRGRLLWLQGDTTAAAQQLALAVDENSLEPDRRLLYCRVLHAGGRTEDAREQLEAARRLAPDNREFRVHIRDLQALLDAP